MYLNLSQLHIFGRSINLKKNSCNFPKLSEWNESLKVSLYFVIQKVDFAFSLITDPYLLISHATQKYKVISSIVLQSLFECVSVRP